MKALSKSLQTLKSELESSGTAGDGPVLVRAGSCSDGRHQSASDSDVSF